MLVSPIHAPPAISLPPLNHRLSRDLIQRTKAAKLLGDFRQMPAVDMDALVDLYIPDVRVGRDTYGRDALRADMDRAFRGVGVTFLHVGNHVIDLVDDDHATGIVYCRGEIQDGGIDSDRFIIHAIQYHDDYRRVDGAWRFVLVHAFAGPILASMLTDNPNEMPAVWCLLSIAILCIGLSPFVRRRVETRRWWGHTMEPSNG